MTDDVSGIMLCVPSIVIIDHTVLTWLGLPFLRWNVPEREAAREKRFLSTDTFKMLAWQLASCVDYMHGRKDAHQRPLPIIHREALGAMSDGDR
jgi:hypothetical protein